MQTSTYLVLLVITGLLSIHLTEGAMGYRVSAKKLIDSNGAEIQYCDVQYCGQIHRVTDKPFYVQIRNGNNWSCFYCSACEGDGSLCASYGDVICEELRAAEAARKGSK